MKTAYNQPAADKLTAIRECCGMPPVVSRTKAAWPSDPTTLVYFCRLECSTCHREANGHGWQIAMAAGAARTAWNKAVKEDEDVEASL